MAPPHASRCTRLFTRSFGKQTIRLSILSTKLITYAMFSKISQLYRTHAVVTRTIYLEDHQMQNIDDIIFVLGDRHLVMPSDDKYVMEETRLSPSKGLHRDDNNKARYDLWCYDSVGHISFASLILLCSRMRNRAYCELPYIRQTVCRPTITKLGCKEVCKKDKGGR